MKSNSKTCYINSSDQFSVFSLKKEQNPLVIVYLNSFFNHNYSTYSNDKYNCDLIIYHLGTYTVYLPFDWHWFCRINRNLLVLLLSLQYSWLQITYCLALFLCLNPPVFTSKNWLLIPTVNLCFPAPSKEIYLHFSNNICGFSPDGFADILQCFLPRGKWCIVPAGR